VRVTHPFHPLSGRVLEYIGRGRSWSGDFVHFFDDQGRRARIRADYTDVVAEDAFVVAAAGRCPFRLEDLIAVAELVERCGRGDGRDRGGRVQGSAP
jgi:hypothetical protein